MKKIFLVVLPALFFMMACKDDPMMPTSPEPDNSDLTDIPYNPQAYAVSVPSTYPNFEDVVPANNPIEVDGVVLGRMLFYDPILSKDSTVSCGTCHLQEFAFTDGLAVSEGVDGLTGTRSSMSLVDLAYNQNGLFWDGRSHTMEAQAIEPVENPVELIEDWDNVEKKLKRHPEYPALFRKAFGISNTSEITRELVTKAIAQFERIIVSSGNSRFDRWQRGELFPTDSEVNGFLMFIDSDDSDLPEAECSHCHTAPLMTVNEYRNNALDPAPSPSDFADFPDAGRGEVTENVSDYGKFRIPTLRNIALTAPYMHDGRFETLEEVIDHYNDGGHPSYNKDPLMEPQGLNEEQKQDLINFLHMLTDEDLLTNPEYSNPFK